MTEIHSVLSCRILPLVSAGLVIHISEQSEWAWPEVMSLDAQRVGLLVLLNSFSLVIPAEHNDLAKTTQNVSDVAGPSP